MQLSKEGREYARWTTNTKDALTGFQIQLADGGAWHTATYVPQVADANGNIIGTVSLLVKGPQWPPTGVIDDGQGVLVTASCAPRVMCTDSPEYVIRQPGWITLY